MIKSLPARFIESSVSITTFSSSIQPFLAAAFIMAYSPDTLYDAKGETLTEDNLAVKRPGNGISPMKWYEILGTKAVRDFEEDEMIEC